MYWIRDQGTQCLCSQSKNLCDKSHVFMHFMGHLDILTSYGLDLCTSSDLLIMVLSASNTLKAGAVWSKLHL